MSGDPAEGALVSGGCTTDTHTREFDIWASPAVLYDPAAGEAVAAVACVPAVDANAVDVHSSADPFNIIISDFLGRGFGLLTELTITALASVPLLEDWSWRLGEDRNHVYIEEPRGVFYEGDLGSDAPPGWHTALARQESLVLLVASDVGLFEPDRTSNFDYTRRSGILVGARIRHP